MSTNPGGREIGSIPIFFFILKENWSKMKNDDMIEKMMIYPKNKGLVVFEVFVSMQ